MPPSGSPEFFACFRAANLLSSSSENPLSADLSCTSTRLRFLTANYCAHDDRNTGPVLHALIIPVTPIRTVVPRLQPVCERSKCIQATHLGLCLFRLRALLLCSAPHPALSSFSARACYSPNCRAGSSRKTQHAALLLYRLWVLRLEHVKNQERRRRPCSQDRLGMEHVNRDTQALERKFVFR